MKGLNDKTLSDYKMKKLTLFLSNVGAPSHINLKFASY